MPGAQVRIVRHGRERRMHALPLGKRRALVHGFTNERVAKRDWLGEPDEIRGLGGERRASVEAENLARAREQRQVSGGFRRCRQEHELGLGQQLAHLPHEPLFQ